ncbi:MAG: hypothetical protein JXR23_02975 [Pontiellaceae bacterium]|nr:hypothetical protein [Pontiellaceae bacterium]
MIAKNIVAIGCITLFIAVIILFADHMSNGDVEAIMLAYILIPTASVLLAVGMVGNHILTRLDDLERNLKNSADNDQ